MTSEPASVEAIAQRLTELEAAEAWLEAQFAAEQKLRRAVGERIGELEQALRTERDARQAAEASIVELEEEREVLQATREELDRQVTRLKQEREGLLEEIEAVGSAASANDR